MKIKLLKIVLIAALLTFTNVLSFGQDYINKSNNDSIKCKVLKIGTSEIEYKKWDNIDGPTYTIIKSEVRLIRYKNGTVDFFDDLNNVQKGYTNKKDIGSNKPNSKQQIDTSKYATLYIYRFKRFEEWLKGYNIHLEDSVICKIKNNSKISIKLYREGKVNLWVKSKQKDEVVLDIKFGEDYYLKLEIITGVLSYEPELSLIDKVQGKIDYSKVKDR
jgi:hypothetical protein